MANDKFDPKKGAASSSADAGASKRTTATIDLKATEVKPDPQASGSKAPDAKSTDPRSPDSRSSGASGKPADTKSGGSSGSSAGSSSSPTGPSVSAGASSAVGSGSSKPGDKPSSGTSEKAASAATASSASTPGSRSGSGIGRFLSMLVAALLGGLAALFGSDQISGLSKQYLGVEIGGSSGSSSSAVSGLTERLAKLEQQSTAGGGGAGELGARLQALSGDIDSLKAATPALDDIKAVQQGIVARLEGLEGGGAAVADVDKRLANLEGTLSTLRAAGNSGEGGQLERLAALSGRINDFGVEIDTRIAGLKDSLSKQIETRTTDLANRFEATNPTEMIATLQAGVTRLGKEIEGLKVERAQLSDNLSAAEASRNQLATQLEAARTARAEVASELDTLKRTTETGLSERVTTSALQQALNPIQESLGKVEKQVSTVVSREEGRQQSTERILLSLELASLKREIERGEPFAEKLAAVKKLAPATIELSALDNYGDAKLPTLTELQHEFDGVARAVLDSVAEPESGSVFDKLISGAKSIVRVRRTGDVPGDGPEAVVARIEAAVQNGDLEKVLGEAAGLPEKGQAAAASWLAKVRARRTVDEALIAVEESLKNSLVPGQTN